MATPGMQPRGADGVPLARREALVAAVPGFGSVRGEALSDLASRMQVERFAGGVVVTEGALGDRLYVIVDGRVEVSVKTPEKRIPLAMLGAGEMFGEIALLSSSRLRSATVTARTPLLTLSLTQRELDAVLVAYPQAEVTLQATSEARLVAKFLKQVSPFATLPPGRTSWLAMRLTPLSVAQGNMIVWQGERGDTCYLIRSGSVEVRLKDATTGMERQIAMLGIGALFGEAALLTDAPRNATVRALEPCKLLRLKRSDLLEAMAGDERVQGRVMELLDERERPRRKANVVAHEGTSSDGELIVTLEDAARNIFQRVSRDGWFIWNLLDGQHTLRDLANAYQAEFKVDGQQTIGMLLRQLALAGFVEVALLRPDVPQPAVAPARATRSNPPAGAPHQASPIRPASPSRPATPTRPPTARPPTARPPGQSKTAQPVQKESLFGRIRRALGQGD